jgi:hypothetical protein
MAFSLDVGNDDTECLLIQVVNKEEIGASYTWEVNPDGHLELLLQSLPANDKSLNFEG